MWARFITVAVAWGGCEPLDLPGDSDPVEPPSLEVTGVAELWGSTPLNRSWTVDEARVVSGPAEDGTVFVQDVDFGHGLAVRRAGHVPDWPPPVGSVVQLRGRVVGPRLAPVLWIEGPGSVVPIDRPIARPRVFGDPSSPRAWTLVSWSDVRVLGDPDPAGRAPTSLGREIDDRFGVVLPGFDTQGDLTGIVLEDGGVAPRFRADWSGEVGTSTPVPRTVRDLLIGDGRVGETVAVSGVQVAPWSPDGRWTVLQDPRSGIGLFVDAEAWGVQTSSRPGDRVTFVAQVLLIGGEVQLRTWQDPVVEGVGVPARASVRRHGALVVQTVSGLGPVDRRGERAVEDGPRLDDRFIPLGDLPDPVTILGVIDRTSATERLVVIDAWGPSGPDTDVPG